MMSNQFDNSNKGSLISDIKNYFTRMRTGNNQGGGNGQAAKQQDEIRKIFDEIDKILISECFFCGNLLLGMVENNFIGRDNGGGMDFDLSSLIDNENPSKSRDEWSFQ